MNPKREKDVHLAHFHFSKGEIRYQSKENLIHIKPQIKRQGSVVTVIDIHGKHEYLFVSKEQGETFVRFAHKHGIRILLDSSSEPKY